MVWVASGMSLPHNSKHAEAPPPPFGADQSSEPRSSSLVIVRAPAMSVEQLVNEDGERRPGETEGRGREGA